MFFPTPEWSRYVERLRAESWQWTHFSDLPQLYENDGWWLLPGSYPPSAWGRCAVYRQGRRVTPRGWLERCRP